MIKYCTKCLYPNTKPDLWFDENGVCSACLSYQNRPEIDWGKEKEFINIIKEYKTENNYDCVVPVSGGKDSFYQVIKALEYGLKPLCVTATTCSLSDIGYRNIQNLRNLGVDHIDVSPNPILRRKINKFTLNEIGDISWPEHLTMFTTPIRIAAMFGIKLIFWGENSQNEYGGPAGTEKNKFLDRRWLEEFGGLLGLRVSDLPLAADIPKKDLLLFDYPCDEILKKIGVTGIFIGHYFPWDSIQNMIIAQAHGFETYKTHVEGHFLNCENLDNYQAGIHEYLMFLKYGYGRATAQASMQIRRKRITRKQALKVVEKNEGKYPSKYLSKSLEEILHEIDMTIDDFDLVCDRFTNKKDFLKDNNDNLIKDRLGNLIKTNYDNEV